MFVTSFHVYGYFQYYTTVGLYASGKTSIIVLDHSGQKTGS